MWGREKRLECPARSRNTTRSAVSRRTRDQYLLPNYGVVVVSVVVVVTGLRTVVSCDVVVVRWVALSELHPVIATRAMATKHGRRIFFISMVV